ncbi:MAG: hypothetical protein WCN95_08585 [bacterium]
MMETDIEQLRKADWVGVEKEVVHKLRMLRAAVDNLEPNELNNKIATDLFIPALAKLGQFCMMIELDESPSRRN